MPGTFDEFRKAYSYAGEIKVTRNLTVAQAFRAALGQIIEYAHLLFDQLPQMVIFLDQELDPSRLQIATKYGITVISWVKGTFKVQNPETCEEQLIQLFSIVWE